MKILKLTTILFISLLINCASGDSNSAQSGSRSNSDSTSSGNRSQFEKVIIGKGKASAAAISSGSKLRSETECKTAARMVAESEYVGGSGAVKGATILSCKETSPNYASCECEVGFPKK